MKFIITGKHQYYEKEGIRSSINMRREGDEDSNGLSYNSLLVDHSDYERLVVGDVVTVAINRVGQSNGGNP